MLTTYAMLGFELFEKFRRQPDLSFPRILQPLTDTFFCFDAGGNVELALIRLGSCTTAFAFPFTVSTTGRLLFLSCFIKSPEGGGRLLKATPPRLAAGRQPSASLSVSELLADVIPRNRRVWILGVLSPSAIELRALLLGPTQLIPDDDELPS